MILQKLTPRADPTLVAKALEQEVELMRCSFAVVRRSGSDEHYLFRGAGAHTIAPVGSIVTFKPARYHPEGQPITAEVVGTGQSPHFLRAVAPPIAAMLAGTWASITGIQMLLGSGDPTQTLASGLAVLTAGICAMGTYVRAVARNQLGGFAAGYIKTAIDDSRTVLIESVEGQGGVRWPRSQEPAALESPREAALLPAPVPDASLTIPPVTFPVPVLAR